MYYKSSLYFSFKPSMIYFVPVKHFYPKKYSADRNIKINWNSFKVFKSGTFLRLKWIYILQKKKCISYLAENRVTTYLMPTRQK
jgi:hypothetical protein